MTVVTQGSFAEVLKQVGSQFGLQFLRYVHLFDPFEQILFEFIFGNVFYVIQVHFLGHFNCCRTGQIVCNINNLRCSQPLKINTCTSEGVKTNKTNKKHFKRQRSSQQVKVLESVVVVVVVNECDFLNFYFVKI